MFAMRGFLSIIGVVALSFATPFDVLQK